MVLAPLVGLTLASAPAHSTPGVPVYPGMEIHQDTNSCTLGYIDPVRRVAYTAGHCRGSGTVTDRAGNFIGTQLMFRDNTPNGSTVATDHVIADWQTIQLAGEVAMNNVLPTGRVLVEDPTAAPQPGQPVCHFGVVTGESCGTVEAVNNGWFTMSNGVVSQKGDSGGPVYTVNDDGQAVLIGMFNSTWGQFPAAVSWQATTEQINEEVIKATSGTLAAA
ncbi:hypothetical protein ABQE92_13050 [Mycolicibacterium thermoresistibile]